MTLLPPPLSFSAHHHKSDRGQVLHFFPPPLALPHTPNPFFISASPTFLLPPFPSPPHHKSVQGIDEGHAQPPLEVLSFAAGWQEMILL